MVCSECKCKYYPECRYGEDTDPCDDCMNGADGSHKRLPKSCRLNDETELPGADWDDAKIAEVTLPEAWQYFCNKMLSSDLDPKARGVLLNRFEAFYRDELEAELYEDSFAEEEDDDEEDEDDTDSTEAVPKAVTDINDVFTELEHMINSLEETRKLIDKIQKLYIDNIELRLYESIINN